MFRTRTLGQNIAEDDLENGAGADHNSTSGLEGPQPSASGRKDSNVGLLPAPVPEIKVASAPEDDSNLGYYSIYDALEGISPEKQETLHRYAFGHHPEIWYKFKRFETLALINLYHYQHELIQMEKTVVLKKGVMSRDERNCLRVVLKDYYDAIDLFKKTSQLKRPSQESREQTVEILAKTLEEKHYSNAADSLALLDLTPQALGVEPDSIRVFIAKTASRFSSNGPTGDISAWRKAVLSGHLEPQITVQAHRKQQESLENTSSPESLPFDTLHPPDSDGPNPEKAEATPGIIVTRTPGASGLEDHSKNIRGRPFTIGISPAVDHLARFAIALVAGVFLLVPMIVLSYIRSKKYCLITTCLFVLVFAGIASLATKASNHELLTATATYAAVLVVFVGQVGQTNFGS